ncbi:hypothetical protein C0J52_09377 [Blattella germanica]|nr:hypothetical protein C0J52_09377 [Blattella germanica]
MVGVVVFIFMTLMLQDVVADCSLGDFEKDLKDYDLSNKNITIITDELPNLCGFLGAERLNFSENSINEISRYGLSGLNKLVTLDLSRNKISNLTFGIFEALSSLQYMSLARNSLVEIDEYIFWLLPNLTSLDFSYNRIISIKERTFQKQNELRWLSLSNNKIKHIPIGLFENLGNLEFLDLSGNLIATIFPKTFNGCQRLSHLTIAMNILTEIKNETFSGLTTLQFLNLSNNELTKVGTDAFKCYNEDDSIVCNLRYIDLSSNKLATFNLQEYFPGEDKFRNLSLILSDNKLKSIDNDSVNWIIRTDIFPELKGNPWNCSCSNLYHAFNVLKDSPPLFCEYPRVIQGESWTALEDVIHCNETDESRRIRDWDSAETDEIDVKNITSQVGGDDRDVEHVDKDFLQTNLIVLGIYACTVLVAIVTILVITHYIGEPEDEEFWWEDKLAKRSY